MLNSLPSYFRVRSWSKSSTMATNEFFVVLDFIYCITINNRDVVVFDAQIISNKGGHWETLQADS